MSKSLIIFIYWEDHRNIRTHDAGIAQLGERQTEDLKVACSIHAHRIFISIFGQGSITLGYA